MDKQATRLKKDNKDNYQYNVTNLDATFDGGNR